MKKPVKNMQAIFNNLTKTICTYLRVNEDLFFASKYDPRINSARKYLSYFAFYKFNIPLVFISSYLGIAEKRSSISMKRAISVYKALQYDYSCQTALDIQAIEKLINYN